jgi:ABC-type lipoprotein release transport system permease subunit
MKLRHLVFKEICHRKLNYLLSVFAVMTAAASLIGSIVLLRMHDIRTSFILQKKEVELQERMNKLKDDTRKAMLKLGFNVVILPEGQNLADWYSEDYSERYMPEEYVERLADSGIMSVRHFLPSLQQKIAWPERKRTIILVGTRGEVPNLHKAHKEPLVQPVPPGTITLGYELHRSMDIQVNDKIKLMGKTFTVNTCYKERGNKDDITAWIHLKEAQGILGKEGLINAILALECLCTGNALPTIRKEITAILPGTQVIERGSRALARAEARTRVAQEARTALEKETQGREELRYERERLASILIPVILLACALWIGLMGIINVHSRREEIAVLMAIGVSATRILSLFVWKHVSIGILGGLLGFFLGVISAVLSGVSNEAVNIGQIGASPFWLGTAALAVGGASMLAVISGWIPAIIASRQDPAEILREE